MELHGGGECKYAGKYQGKRIDRERNCGIFAEGGVAEVIERGEEWTHVISGGVEGYIKDEFLAYGDEAKKLAGVYGTQGVEISWDDVNMFSRPDCCSSVLKKAKGGSEYTLLEKEGAWYAVQMDDVTVAYVPAEDVQKTTILEKAISLADSYGESDGTYTASNWQQEYTQNTAGDAGVYTGTSDETAAATEAQTPDSYQEPDGTDAAQTETPESTGEANTAPPTALLLLRKRQSPRQVRTMYRCWPH